MLVLPKVPRNPKNYLKFAFSVFFPYGAGTKTLPLRRGARIKKSTLKNKNTTGLRLWYFCHKMFALCEASRCLHIFSGQGGDIHSLHQWAHAHCVRANMINPSLTNISTNPTGYDAGNGRDRSLLCLGCLFGVPATFH